MLGSLRHDQVLAYIDDLIIPSVDVDSEVTLLKTVLQLNRGAGLKLSLSKCSFLKESVAYLGREVSSEGLRPGEHKIKAIADFPIPTDVHEVR